MKALKTIVIFSLFLFVTASHADAQRSLNPNQALYGEVWLITPDQSRGAAGISYERFFSPRKTISIKLGPVPSFSAKIVSFPVMIQGYTSSGRKHHVEFGGGIAPTFDYFDEFKVTFYPMVLGGYRFYRGTGLMIRATMNFVVYPDPFPAPSFSIGYAFN